MVPTSCPMPPGKAPVSGTSKVIKQFKKWINERVVDFSKKHHPAFWSINAASVFSSIHTLKLIMDHPGLAKRTLNKMAVLLKRGQVLMFHQISTLCKHFPLRPGCKCLPCITITPMLKQLLIKWSLLHADDCAYGLAYLTFPWLWVLYFSFPLSANISSNRSTLQFSVCWRSTNTMEFTLGQPCCL